MPDDTELLIKLIRIDKELLKGISEDLPSLKKIDELFLELKKVMDTASDEELSDKVHKESLRVMLRVIEGSQEFCEKWHDGKIFPSDEELNFLEKNFNNFGKIGEKEIKLVVNSDIYPLLKKKIESSEKTIKEEKIRRQNSPGGGSPPPSKNSKNIDKQITNLQSRIKVLENKKEQVSNNSDDFRRYEKEIEQLKSELKEKEKEKTQSGNDFPWKPIFIIGGGVILVLVIILLLKMIFKKK